MVSPFPVIQTRVKKKGKYLQARSCEIESCFCVDERRRFIYKVLLFIKVNIEPFFRRCGITTSPFFSLRGPHSFENQARNNSTSSGESPQGHHQRKCSARYHTRLIPKYFISEMTPCRQRTRRLLLLFLFLNFSYTTASPSGKDRKARSRGEIKNIYFCWTLQSSSLGCSVYA